MPSNASFGVPSIIAAALLEVCKAVDVALVYGVRGILVTLASKQVLADKKLLFDDLIKYVYLHSG